MIEVEVHASLRAFLREQGKLSWPHHLTMARLVARALRLGRSALIQTGSTQGRYRLSYLAPALLWRDPVILVAPISTQQWLLRMEIPLLREWIGTDKPIQIGDSFPNPEFKGLLITSPTAWLCDRIFNKGGFPPGIPTIIDGADDLEDWTKNQLKCSINPWDWDELMLACPQEADLIRDVRVRLTKAVFQHPPNPYNCYLIEEAERNALQQLFAQIDPNIKEEYGTLYSWEDDIYRISDPRQEPYRYLPKSWRNFWHSWQKSNWLIWAGIARSQGQFSLYCEPIEVADSLSQIWSDQPVVLIGRALDLETSASVYRQRLCLGELTCLKFSPDRTSELIQLYLPDGIPMPNTPQFQEALTRQVRSLINLTANGTSPVVILVSDVPLKAQLGTILAAEFGSRVAVEKTELGERGILVCSWEFWRSHQELIPNPRLLIITTLPIPSLENPLVAGQVKYYKDRHLDWFRLYLLPTALNELQRAIAPVRASQGVIALLDNRVNHRSYGTQVLSALSPFARINYLDASWFESDRIVENG